MAEISGSRSPHDDVLASLHGTPSAIRIEVRERGPLGRWTLMSVTPLPTAPFLGSAALHLAADRIALQFQPFRVEVYQRTSPTTLVLESGFDGEVRRLEEEYLVASVFDSQRLKVNVLPFDELASGLSPCFTAGRSICTGQRGGALRYLPAGVASTDAVWVQL